MFDWTGMGFFWVCAGLGLFVFLTQVGSAMGERIKAQARLTDTQGEIAKEMGEPIPADPPAKAKSHLN